MSRGPDNVMDYDSGGLERNFYLDGAWGLRSKNIAPIAAEGKRRYSDIGKTVGRNWQEHARGSAFQLSGPSQSL
jgi:hypothetical protein